MLHISINNFYSVFCVPTIRRPHCLPAVAVGWRYPDSQQPVGTSARTGTSVTASVSQTHDRVLYPHKSSLGSIQHTSKLLQVFGSI